MLFRKICMRILLILSLIIFTTSAWSQNNIIDNDHFKKLYSERKFDDIWGLIKDLDNPNDDSVNFTKGILLGSGLLTTGLDLCEAVRHFERIEERGGLYARAALNNLYEGDWISIAALEGSRIAIYHKAIRLLNAKFPLAPSLMANSTLQDKNLKTSIQLLQKASEMGLKKANIELEKLKLQNLKSYNNLTKESTSLVKKPMHIICAIRQY